MNLKATALAFSTAILAACAGMIPVAGKDPLAQGLTGDVGVTSGAGWELADGVLSSVPSESMGFVYTRDRYDDFEMFVEFYPEGQTNSGVFARCEDPTQISPVNCYEFNIWDSHENPEFRTGAIVMHSPPQIHVATEDRWNQMRIRAEGGHLRVWVNGQLTNDIMDDSYQSGHIALQYGGMGGSVKFRNWRLSEI